MKILLMIALAVSSALAHADRGREVVIPPLAHKLRPDLVRSAHFVFGLAAPIPILAAQIHQESAWNPRAQSPYARGLTQFTPGTESDMNRLYGRELGAGGAWDVGWSLRAQSRYMFALEKQLGGATPCDAMQFALSGYNGGPGWVMRDRALAARGGHDPTVYDNIRPFNAGRAPQFFAENRDYPRRIVFFLQPAYAAWGPTLCLGSS
jgi:hypothetical protein